jgi:hypothetical protein
MLCAAAVALGAQGCAGLPECMGIEPQYVLVERSDSQVAGLPPRAEITDTPTYKTLHSRLKSVALRLPDNCFRRAALADGTNVEAATLESTCGVPLQVLESTLTRAGFQVLSWSTLMGIEREQRVPVHIAAQQLGADFVIIINTMYAGPARAGSAAEATYRYFESDPEGQRHGPAQLFQADRAWLKEFIRGRAGNDPQAKGATTVQAELSATVVLAKSAEPPPPAPSTMALPVASFPGQEPTPALPPGGVGRSGESIWFYNWRVGSVASAREGMRFLFGGIPASRYQEVFANRPAIATDDPNSHYWWPALPTQKEAVPPAPADRAASEETFTSKVDVMPAEAAVLSRKIAEDFIHRFKGG